MLALLLIGLLSDAKMDGPPVGPEQFLSLIRSIHATYRDVSFRYEGEFRYVGPPKFVEGDPAAMGYAFQGSYVFRADGAVRQELYRRGFVGDQVIVRTDLALLNGKGQKRSVTADVKVPEGPPREFRGPVAMLFTTGSAKRMLFSWFFDALTDPAEQGYQYLGWQELDGHSCLNVQLNDVHGSREPSYFAYRFWIDLERGGHPLRFEMVAGGKVRLRVDSIKLERLVPERGKEVWMPTTAAVETFLWGDEVYSYPFFKETYAMVNGSFRLNQSYSDKTFVLTGKELSLEGSTLQSFRKEFDDTPQFRSDLEGVQMRLDNMLKKADEMSQRLDAGSPGDNFWGNPVTLSFGFTTLGICILAGVGFWKRKNR
jgi:hypothetical protein